MFLIFFLSYLREREWIIKKPFACFLYLISMFLFCILPIFLAAKQSLNLHTNENAHLQKPLSMNVRIVQCFIRDFLKKKRKGKTWTAGSSKKWFLCLRKRARIPLLNIHYRVNPTLPTIENGKGKNPTFFQISKTDQSLTKN